MIYRSLLSFGKKALIVVLLGATLYTSALTPLVSFAQQNNADLPQNPGTGGVDGGLFPGNANQGSTEGTVNFEITDEQAATTLTGSTESPSNSVSEATTDIAAKTLTCSAAQILGQILTSAISAAVSALIEAIVGEVAKEVVVNTTTVPVNTTFDASGQNQLGGGRARDGDYTFFGIFKGVSWDSIAWCVVNAMIEYIADATIAWANSGFNGNPAFIENPERFFSDLADYQAGKIIQDIAYGATDGAVNVCKPFKVGIAVGLAKSYGGSGQSQLNSQYKGMSCRLSDITSEKFFGGVSVSTTGSNYRSGGNAITWSDWLSVSQRDENNPYGAYILANEALYTAVTAKNNELRFEIGLNNGWLNFKKCKDGETDQSKCDTVTPGRLIESQLNQTLGLSKQRLVMADKFDQMITAIVNNLIKIALNEVLEETKD